MQKVIEVHSGLSALLAEKSTYDGLWISSLTHATIHGMPDNELVNLTERADLIREVRRISQKPIIVDVDTFGPLEHSAYYVNLFEKAGATAIVIEDKKFPKENSLLKDAHHDLVPVDEFCNKLMFAKAQSKGLKIYARIESLIAKKSRWEAILRAQAYLGAGADGILVHSKVNANADEVMDVGDQIREKYPKTTLIAVPTTYTLPEVHPFDIVINANHLMRASLKAMQKYINGEEVELASVEEIFSLCGH